MLGNWRLVSYILPFGECFFTVEWPRLYRFVPCFMLYYLYNLEVSKMDKVFVIKNEPTADELWAGIGGNFDSLSQIVCEFIDNSISFFKSSNNCITGE